MASLNLEDVLKLAKTILKFLRELTSNKNNRIAFNNRSHSVTDLANFVLKVNISCLGTQ